MNHMVSREQDPEVDLEAGLSDVRQESTSDNGVWSERVSFGVTEKIDDDISRPLMGEANPSNQRLNLSEKKCENVKVKKSRKASKPPRPPKGPCLSASDHKVMREITELAMRKRERIERMKHSLRRLKAAKSSSSSTSCINILSMMFTVLVFAFLVFQGIFASNPSLVSEKSPAPIISPNNRMVPVQFDSVFAPVEQTDPSPTTSFRYTRKLISGAEEEEGSRYVNR